MINKIKYIAMIFVLGVMGSCKSFLEEEPKSLLTADYLKTKQGVNAALNSCYSDLRYLYGGETGMVATCTGTDEWQKAQDGNANFNLYQAGMSADGSMGGMWNWGYTSINTCNAVIKYAPTSGMTASEATAAIVQAKYIRALWYFTEVQTYGSCPLNLEFIDQPATTAYKAPVADIYAAIIADLEEAKLALPAKAAQPGRITAAAAYHLLAKVYLTKATMASSSPVADYQLAYDNAMNLINNRATYGLELLQDFANVFVPGNEHSSEVIMTVEKNADILYNNAGTNTGGKSNQAFMLFRSNYPTWVKGLIRDIPYGRPWHRERPTNYLLNVVFKDKTNDTRYFKSFQSVWLVNDPANVEDKSFVKGDTAAYLPGTETFKSVRALKTFKPSEYYDEVLSDGKKQTISVYPPLSKFDDTQRPEMNESSVRPFIVFRLAETYLIAAEAAMYLGKSSESVNLLNVVRDRGAYSSKKTSSEIALSISVLRSAVPAMTAGDAGIDFILDERSRELCGEYMRWWDLVRTRTSSGLPQLLQRIRNMVPAHPAAANIQDYHVLRPIPQGQLDLVSNKDEFKQNPGY